MFEVRTYSSSSSSSEDQQSNDNNEQSKRVLCPHCKKIGYTIIKKECDFCTCFCILLFPILACCFFFNKNFNQTIVHHCRYCNHDCTNVKSYKEDKTSSFCIII